MKKIKLDAKRLQLKKEKIANLTGNEMNHIAGGDGESSISIHCPTMTTCAVSCRDKCEEPDTAVCPTSILISFCIC